jgi:sugar-specific transcriptional regulator TrmB
MKNVTEYLEHLDLLEGEAKIYLKLLETGPLSIRELARTTGIKRPTAYMYIDQLAEKGLVVKLVKGSRAQVAANQPEEILPELVAQKVQFGKKIEDALPQILDTIHTTFPQKKAIGEAEIKYYKGKKGVKRIYEDMFKSKELRSYFNIEITVDAFPENGDLFREALKNNKTIKMFEILEDSSASKKEVAQFQSNNANHERYFYKFLPRGVSLSAADVLIYDGKVAIINVSKQITGVILQNTDYYNNSKELFDLIWKVLPEGKREQTG